MIKRLLTAALLTGTALILAILSLVYVKNVSGEMLILAEKADALLSADGDYSYEARELISMWDENSLLFGIIIKHADADTLDRYFLLLEEYLSEGDSEKFSTVLSELRAFLTVLSRGEGFSIENIF